MSENPFAAVERHSSVGEFRQALDSLLAQKSAIRRSDDFHAWHAELLSLTGDSKTAENIAASTLQRDVPKPIETRLRLTLGIIRFETGRLPQSFEEFQKAIASAATAGDATLLARCHLALLSFFSDVGATDNVVALFAATKKAVAHAADPHLLAALRMSFAKAEASRQSTREARRHFMDVGELLKAHPHACLSARQQLGLSVLDAIEGDLEGAAEHAQRAIDFSRRAGHRRTERAGLINLSHALQGLGDLNGAKRCIVEVQRTVGSDIEFNLAVLDSKANVLISEGFLAEATQVLAELDALVSNTAPEFRSRWLRWTLAETKARHLLALGQPQAAESLIQTAIKQAAAGNDTGCVDHLRVALFTSLVLQGKDSRAAPILQRPRILSVVYRGQDSSGLDRGVK